MTASKEVLLGLAARCEAEGPSSKLDVKIAAVAYGFDRIEIEDDSTGPRYYGYRGKQATELAPRMMRPYTTSLDAAVTLVPEGCGIDLSRYWRKEPGEWWSVVLAWGTQGDHADAFDVRSAALALCAAALKARAEIAGHQALPVDH